MLIVVLVPTWLQSLQILGESLDHWWARRLGPLGYPSAVMTPLDDLGDAHWLIDGTALRANLDLLRPADGPRIARDEVADSYVIACPRADAAALGQVVTEDVAKGPIAARALDVARLNRLVAEIVRDQRRVVAEIAYLPGGTDGLVVSPTVRLDPGVTLWPGVQLLGSTHIETGATLQAGCHLRDTTVGPHTVIRAYTVAEDASLGAQVQVGPFSHLRTGTRLDDRAKVGNFVETKKTHLAEGAKANHLTYLGDCEIGARTNIGAGTITCNYDGARKHRTRVGDDVFIGTHTALVAPITVGDGALIAAGSTLTGDVPPGALAFGRARQHNVAERGAQILHENRRLKAEETRGEET